ncbi:beta-defensin 131B [Sciurus carolinensis]|uniref:beta-defensin 131B n=1 Tax=Sciurus carolinensis TaxID=30640 RepID=UPI001FB396FC|nr:beta-defensin 131B [Sciurus carolinensis]
MRVLLSILGLLAWWSVVPPARNFVSRTDCSTGYYNCRMACKADEYAIRYCKDWKICCKKKQFQIIKKKRKW